LPSQIGDAHLRGACALCYGTELDRASGAAEAEQRAGPGTESPIDFIIRKIQGTEPRAESLRRLTGLLLTPI